jgi:hypothetical protein
MTEPINLRPVIRAMNEHSDTEWGDGWRWIRCRWQGRKRITVTDDGVIHVSGLEIRPEDRPLWKDIFLALDGEWIPERVMGGTIRPARVETLWAIKRALRDLWEVTNDPKARCLYRVMTGDIEESALDTCDQE